MVGPAAGGGTDDAPEKVALGTSSPVGMEAQWMHDAMSTKHQPATWHAKPGPSHMLTWMAVIWLALTLIQMGVP